MRIPIEVAARDERCWRLSTDVSPDAVTLLRKLPFDGGTRVRVRFALPRGPAIDAPGCVEEPTEVSLATTPEQRAAWSEWLAAREDA